MNSVVIIRSFLQLPEEAIVFLLKAHRWSEAERTAALHDRMDMVESHVKPSINEAVIQLAEELTEVEERFHKYRRRLVIVRTTPLEQRGKLHSTT